MDVFLIWQTSIAGIALRKVYLTESGAIRGIASYVKHRKGEYEISCLPPTTVLHYDFVTPSGLSSAVWIERRRAEESPLEVLADQAE